MSVCLNMIVKNEAPILSRCLRSVRPVISCYVICDTGSVDRTKAVIEEELAGLPGLVLDIPFHDFSQARNAALQAARQSPLAFDYLLLTDADMELVGEGWVELTKPAYRLRQTSPWQTYPNLRLVRRDVPAQYVGATHEYLSSPGGLAPLLLTPWFKDHACGANRVAKADRDLRLLTTALEQDPNDTRSMFYLAQTYWDIQQYAQAAEWYTKRIQAGGWREEAWYSRYKLALCYKALGRGSDFLDEMLAAYHVCPSRAEPLYELAKHYRQIRMYAPAMMFCETGSAIPYPQDGLFVDDAVYRYGFLEEWSVIGYYSQQQSQRARGREACRRLATDETVPAAVRDLAAANLRFYAAA